MNIINDSRDREMILVLFQERRRQSWALSVPSAIHHCQGLCRGPGVLIHNSGCKSLLNLSCTESSSPLRDYEDLTFVCHKSPDVEILFSMY